MASRDPKDEAGQESRERDATDPNQPRKRTISGPGAADFLAAPGGLDTPESDPAKGTRAAADDTSLTSARDLTPDLDEPRDATERERLVDTPDRSSDG